MWRLMVGSLYSKKSLCQNCIIDPEHNGFELCESNLYADFFQQ